MRTSPRAAGGREGPGPRARHRGHQGSPTASTRMGTPLRICGCDVRVRPAVPPPSFLRLHRPPRALLACCCVAVAGRWRIGGCCCCCCWRGCWCPRASSRLDKGPRHAPSTSSAARPAAPASRAPGSATATTTATTGRTSGTARRPAQVRGGPGCPWGGPPARPGALPSPPCSPLVAEAPPCGVGEFLCDGRRDCPDGTDESAEACQLREALSSAGPSTASTETPYETPGPFLHQAPLWVIATFVLLSVLVGIGCLTAWQQSRKKTNFTSISLEKTSKEQLMPARRPSTTFP